MTPETEKTADLPEYESWTDAHAAGDRRTAERMFAAQNARSGVGAEGDAPRPDFNFQPPMPERGEVDQAADDLIDAGGENLVRDWGGPESETFRQQLAFAHYAMEEVRKTDPALIERLLEDDDPALVRWAAKLGRSIAYDTGETIYPKLNVPLQSKGKTMPNETRNVPPRRGNVSAGDRHEELTQEMHKALERGDRMRADRINRQRQALSESLGSEPIVGTGGRHAW
jgi:hypothetical protein